ncbi:MAG: ceramidase domain-containing protein [Syntrophobacteraceae bacterium]
MASRGVKVWTLLLTAAAGIIAVAFISPIAQDPVYHHFADSRTVFNVPNFWNVASNLPFVLVGLLGLTVSRTVEPTDESSAPGIACKLFFIGLILTGLGSAYYHLAPSTPTLFWDRLPMTISFMAFLALILGDSISPVVEKRALGPLLFIGVGSVVYWYWTESNGAGDLRLYGLVQFLPMLLIPLTLLLFGSRTFRTAPLWGSLGLYALAKVAESLDTAIFGLTRVVSGHSIKHLLAAGGAFCVFLAFRGKQAGSQRRQKAPSRACAGHR